MHTWRFFEGIEKMENSSFPHYQLSDEILVFFRLFLFQNATFQEEILPFLKELQEHRKKLAEDQGKKKTPAKRKQKEEEEDDEDDENEEGEGSQQKTRKEKEPRAKKAKKETSPEPEEEEEKEDENIEEYKDNGFEAVRIYAF